MTQTIPPRVLNAHVVGRDVPGAVYIGRPSPWGNPIRIDAETDRSLALAQYIDWLHDNPEFVSRARRELAGKDLICWCAPRACHGDILLDLALGKPLPARRAQIAPLKPPGERLYRRADVAAFCRTREAHGAFSNMHADFPLSLRLSGDLIQAGSSEAWYQALRYPDLPEFQAEILAASTPMASKKLAYTRLEQTRPDWSSIRIVAMRHALRLKALCHRHAFESLMAETGDRPIVEISTRDRFWGAQPTQDGILAGANVLGRLLMELREEMKSWMPLEPAELPVKGSESLSILGRPVLDVEPVPIEQRQAHQLGLML